MNFLKAASVCPVVTPAHPEENADEIIRLLGELSKEGIQAAVFPELCVTGYTCADLFFQDRLWDKTLEALEKIRAASAGSQLIFAAGTPYRVGSRLYNCAAVFQDGELLGLVPKTFLPNYSEFYEKRWFASLAEMDPADIAWFNGKPVPFGRLLFQSKNLTLGIEVCEDLWAPHPPSTDLALAGADIILNLSASNELVAKSDYRRLLVETQSARLMSGYLYSSAGVGESSTDVVFSGHLVIAENGNLLAQNEGFQTSSEFITAWIDVDRLRNERMRSNTYRESHPGQIFTAVHFNGTIADLSGFDRPVSPTPFIPPDPELMSRRCKEIFSIQSHALAKRLRAIGAKHCVIGISGGLDSTLALLVINKAVAINGMSRDQIITVTMPGFGTTDRTYGNAVSLCRELGTDFREINIKEASLLHFRDIGHDPAIHDSTYENTQARERTQILMDIANKEQGIVVGTGDLSELALGWATYNGDHMSMYGVNASVPKTLVRYLVRYAADHESELTVRKILHDILDTPVSPELLPSDAEGKIAQKTEDIIGPYELHDFFLYHMLRYGAPPEKILFLAEHAFSGRYPSDTIRKWLTVFIKRFFTSQFKRSALPDGPKVGSVALSPRGDLRMPSDVTYRSWIIE